MAGRVHLAILILTAYVNGCWCVNWDKLKFKALNAVGWESSTVTGVPSLEFVDNFMIPCRHDPKQIMVGNGNGFSPNSGEGCIQIYYMRNMSKPVKKIVGNCSRQISGSFNFNNGIGLAARIKWPDHGYITEDGQWLLFVDNKSCARKMKMTTKQVTTVIGQCSSGTLDLGHHGQARLVIGMVYLDEKNYWVFFVKSGLYIYSWSGDSRRKVAGRNQMSAFHGSNLEAGLITKGTRTSNNFEVFQKVQYGVTRYNFDRINLTHHSFAVNDLRPSKLFSLKPNPDPDAKYKFDPQHRPMYMTASNGHVAQHPYHQELLMVTDWAESQVFVFNIDDGMALLCNTVVHGQIWFLPSVRSTLWVGGGALSAIVVDRSKSRTYELEFNYDSHLDNKCTGCWNAPGESRCHSSRYGVECLCTVGYTGHNCVNAVCPPNKCNGHGQCTFDDTNRPKCTCNNGWIGETCKYQKALSLEYVGITELQYGHGMVWSTLAARPPRVGEGFLLNMLNNPSVLIVGHRHWGRNNEGEIGYYRLGRMKNFVSLAGNLSRTRGPSKYDDGTGANAHMVKPMFGYQEKNGKWLHFVDSNSCARRLSLSNTLKVTTWCGIGRCGNGTLNLNEYGSQTRVTGMTMIEFVTKAFVFSGPFGIYIYNWSGSLKRHVVGGWASFYEKQMDITGSLTGRYQYNDIRPVFFQNTPYGITKYDFRWGVVKATNTKFPFVFRIASLKPYSTLFFEKRDDMATHNFDYNQPNTFGGAGGIIDINPIYRNILMVADHGKGSVVIYNITSGTSLSVCRDSTGPYPSIDKQTNNAATCKWVELKSAMWLTATTALVSDYSIHGRVYKVSFRIGVNACASNPCGHGICFDLESGFNCHCDDDWSGPTCSDSTPRVGAVFPVLGSFDTTNHLISIGTFRSETFSIMMFTASLTSCTVI